jgi:dihydrofolate reductase
MKVSLIAAVADNGVIGRAGTMPWRLPGDLRHFKAVTMGKPVVMGRRTFQSLGEPLPGRANIVITRDLNFTARGALVVHSLKSALLTAEKEGAAECMIIGGGEIYALALPLAERFYLTEVHASPAGDTCFPEFDRAAWHETARDDKPAEGGGSPAHSFVVLERNT